MHAFISCLHTHAYDAAYAYYLRCYYTRTLDLFKKLLKGEEKQCLHPDVEEFQVRLQHLATKRYRLV